MVSMIAVFNFYASCFHCCYLNEKTENTTSLVLSITRFEKVEGAIAPVSPL